jgi:hypothetical protein
MTTITNDWITLEELRNGVTVQRKFAGLETRISTSNEVTFCKVLYWERELYPNDEVIKTELKHYSLSDLPETVNDAEGWRMEPLAVLSGFIQSLGYPGIINPARETLAGEVALSVNSPDGYILHSETREKIAIEP